MLEIKRSNFKETGHFYDYKLNNGTYLHESEWNGEVYTVKQGKEEKIYKPVYKEITEDQFDIIGFEE